MPLDHDVASSSTKVYDLLPRIIAARARSLGADKVELELSFSALTTTLLELNTQFEDLAASVPHDDPHLLLIANVVSRIAISVETLLDAIEMQTA